MVINTSRGALIDSTAAIDALKQQKIGALGMDVYENERDLFFEDKSNDVIQDDVFRRLGLPQRAVYRPSGLPDRRGADQHFANHAAEHHPAGTRRSLPEPVERLSVTSAPCGALFI